MLEARKILVLTERVHAEGGLKAERPITRVAACALIANPLAGQAAEDLAVLIESGAPLGRDLVAEALKHLSEEVVCYGKAAVVGVEGDLEHGAAIVHPSMGRPMREAIGGGKALIPSNVKIGGPGTVVDVPLGHRNDPWLFDYIDTMSIFLADGPRPREMAIIVALSDGGRARPRVGKGGAPLPPQDP